MVFMVLGSYERFSVVLNGSLWFSIVSLWFSVVTSNSYWLPVVLNCYYLVVHNGFRWFSMVTSSSQLFSMVLSTFRWF